MALFQARSRSGIKGAQLADAIRDHISAWLLKDMPGSLVTVVSVSLTLDAQNATVWMRVFPIEKANKTVLELNKSARRYERQLLHVLRRRAVPALRFTLDTNPEDSLHLDELLNQG